MTEPAATEALPDRAGRWADLLIDLARKTYRDSIDDRLPGLAAEVAFFLLVALPPLALVALGALSFVGSLFGEDAVMSIGDQLIEWSGAVLTTQTVNDTVRPAVAALLDDPRIDVFSLGLVLTVWSASRAARVIIRSITRAYDLEEKRRGWVRRTGLAIALTAGGVVAVAVLLPLLVVGPEFGEGLAEEFGLARVFEVVWRVLYWPVVVAVGIALLTWVYHIVPPWRTRFVRDVPGAALALAVWALGSFGLRVYAVNFVESDNAFQIVGAPLVALLWIYLTAIALLVGAELNAEIEKRWPYAGSPHWSEGRDVAVLSED